METKERKVLTYIFYGLLFGNFVSVTSYLFGSLDSVTNISFQTLIALHFEKPILAINYLTSGLLCFIFVFDTRQSAGFGAVNAEVEDNPLFQGPNIGGDHYFLEALIKCAPFAVVRLDESHRIISFNPAFENLFGFSGNEIQGRHLDTLIAPGDFNEEASDFTNKVSSGSIIRKESRRKRIDDSYVDVEIIGVPVIVEGKKIGILGLYQDISKRKKAERELQESEARFKTLFNNSPISLWEEDFSEVKKVLDQVAKKHDVKERLKNDKELVEKCIALVKILDVNQATLDMYEASSKSKLVENFSQILVEDSLDQFRNELIALLSGERSFECEIVQKKQNGDLITGLLHLSIAPGYEDTWGKIIISIMDISDRKQAEEKLRFFSLHDSLTGLFNRTYFDEEMERLELSRQFPVSIIVCDLDNLKHINDTMGHAYGDGIIKATGTILKAVVFRKEDVVARIGGDEFAIILPNVDIEENKNILERLDQAIIGFNENEVDDDTSQKVSLSYGFAVIHFGNSLLEGYRRADDMMYLNKLLKKDERGLIPERVSTKKSSFRGDKDPAFVKKGVTNE